MSDEIRIQLPPEENIFANGWIKLTEKFIPLKNEVWIFHKNDPDSLPSKPHGHNRDTGEKINPYTGEIFNQSGVVVRNLGRRQLGVLHNRLRQAGFALNGT